MVGIWLDGGLAEKGKMIQFVYSRGLQCYCDRPVKV